MTSSKRVGALLASLEAQGCTVRRTKSGWWVGFPNGDSTTLHLTFSDHRSELNFRSYVKRAGLRWPFDDNH